MMSKAYKTIGQGVAALLALSASFVVSGASPKDHDVIAVGPVELVEISSITVLGRPYRMEDTSGFFVGEKVAVHGALQPDGSASNSWAESLGTYSAGSDPIFETGVVTSVDLDAGLLSIGDSKVDYTATLAETSATAPTVGQLVSVAGIQPTAGGLILGSSTNAGITGMHIAMADTTRLTKAGISGSSAMTDGISGSSAMTDGISGSSAMTDGISGSSAMTD